MARYKKGASARDFDLFGPQLQFSWITPQLVKAEAVTTDTLKKEYTRLRDIAQKRIKRMQGKPEAAGTLAQLPEGGFPKLQGQDRESIVMNLIDISSFLTARRGSLSGIREMNKQVTETLAKKGIDVPKDQLNNFGTFMGAMRKALNIKRGDYASGQVASIYSDLLERGKISKTAVKKKINEIMKDIESTGNRKFTKAERMEKNKLIQEGSWQDWFDLEENK